MLNNKMANREGPSQTAQMCRLIWAFIVPIWYKGPLCMLSNIFLLLFGQTCVKRSLCCANCDDPDQIS